MNTPNKLTILRVILIPVYMVLYLLCGNIGMYFAIAVFIIATLTDNLDGYLARKNNQVTTFGKLMDPIADKMLTTAAFLVFMQKDIPYINAGVIMVILSREFIVTGFRLVAAGENKVIAASMWGKSKTVSQFVLIMWVMLAEIFLMYLPEFKQICDVVTLIMVTVVVVLTVYSGLDYIVKNKNIITFK